MEEEHKQRTAKQKDPQPKKAAHNAVEAALAAAPEPHHDEHQRKVAIVTGASSGIGKAVAMHLAGSNYDVVLVARKRDALHEVEIELSKYKTRTLVRECDVTKVVQVHDTVNHTVKMFGRIDVLVNCAGYGIYGDIDTMRLEDINGQMLTNYFGTVLFIKECLPHLKEHRGSIVNVASMAGLVGIPKMAAYAASKHAVVGLSESLRFELDKTGVSISCVCPGKVKTNFFKNESFTGVPYADSDDGIAPGAVARAVDRAIHERKFLYIVPSSNRLLLYFGRLMPESIRTRIIKQSMKQI